MWSGTVGLVNGKHRYLTAETFGFKINSNGQQLKRRQQWTIEPFPEMTGPDGSISSAASVTSQPACPAAAPQVTPTITAATTLAAQSSQDSNDACIMTLSAGGPLVQSSLASASSMRTNSSNESSSSNDPDGYGEEHENVALKSHLNKYLAVDSFGNVTCDSDEKTENARFTITICSMSQGRSKDEHIFWAFKNYERGYYLGTTDDGMICCNAKMPKSRAELWHLHLLPARGASFFALKSLGRKRFARVTSGTGSGQHTSINGASVTCAGGKQVQLDANISWGSETLFQFKYQEGGRYSLLTSDNRLLTNEGQCIGWQAEGAAAGGGAPRTNSNENGNINVMQQQQLPPPECLFTLEYHSGYLAFRDSFGQYLAAAGRSSVLRSRSIGVSRDELFMFETVPVQVSLKATFNNRWVSIKQGVDLSANQTETTSRYETFQLTYHKQTHNWSIMTHDCNFWTISHNTTSNGNSNGSNNSSNSIANTVSVCRPGDYEGLTRGQFKLIWSDSDATFSLKYVDLSRQERWISARKSGQLFVGGASHEPVKFVMRFQNRRLLNLRPVDGSGFVGLKGSGGANSAANARQLEANKTAPDSILIEYPELSISDSSSLSTLINATTNGANKLPADSFVASAAQAKLANNSKNGFAFDSGSSEQQKVINVFNVKLNTTKMGQSVFEKFSADQSQQATASEPPPQANNVTNIVCTAGQKDIDFGIDANNNTSDGSCMMEREYDSQKMYAANERVGGGGVESASAPSVASIINSFSSAKIGNQQPGSGYVVGNSEQQQQQQQQRIVGSSVSKLASSFEQPSGFAGANGPLKHQQQLDQLMANGDTYAGVPLLDTASVVTCSSSSVSSAFNGAPSTIVQPKDMNSSVGCGKNSLADQVAQSECCYLKALTNNKYLVVGDEIAASGTAADAASIVCDATNRACAQAWILELRSHNSIAIRASDNHAYMQLGTNGTIHMSRCDPKDASLWEF